MYRVFVDDNVRLDIKDLVKELYSRHGHYYATDINKGIAKNIEFLATNALTSKLEPIIQTNRRTYRDVRKIGYRGYYLIYKVEANTVYIIDFTNIIK